MGVQDLGTPPSGVRFVRGLFGGYGDLHLQAPESARAIHCDAIYNGPFTGGGSEEGIAGPQEVLGAGGTGFCRPEGGR